jgi:hypothetical protein
MRLRPKLLAPPLSVAALLVVLCIPAAAQGQNKKGGGGPPNPTEQQKKLMEQQKKALQQLNQAKGDDLRFAEAEALRTAYLLLLEANADYDGHRANAMKAVEHALKLLDDHVLNHGTDPQKAATKKAKADLAAAIKARNAVYTADGPVTEAQQASDAQVRQAGEMLAAIQGVLEKNKQGAVLKPVKKAVEEIQIALKVN